MPRSSASAFASPQSGRFRFGCRSFSPVSVSIGTSCFCTQAPGPRPDSSGLPIGLMGVPSNWWSGAPLVGPGA